MTSRDSVPAAAPAPASGSRNGAPPIGNAAGESNRAQPTNTAAGESNRAQPTNNATGESHRAQPTNNAAGESNRAQPTNNATGESHRAQPTNNAAGESNRAQPIGNAAGESNRAQPTNNAAGESNRAQPTNNAAGESNRTQPTSNVARKSGGPPASLAIWQPAYIGLGSNLNDSRANVLLAIEKLRAIPNTRVIAQSKLYGSKPFGPVKQGDFVNAVVGLLTQLDAPALLKQTQAIELALGRPEKHERWGPRIIDLDLLIYGREQRAEPALTIPHPGIVERNWVLYPLADIAPSLDIPGVGRVAELKGNIAPEGLWTL